MTSGRVHEDHTIDLSPLKHTALKRSVCQNVRLRHVNSDNTEAVRRHDVAMWRSSQSELRETKMPKPR